MSFVLSPRFCDDQDPTVELQYVDVVSVELAQDFGPNDLFGGRRWPPVHR